MPNSAQPADTSNRLNRLLGAAIVACVLALLAWGLFTLAGDMLGQTRDIRCQNNLKSIAEAITLYRVDYGGQTPPYLASLLPRLQARADVLVCPADPDKGANGCRPAWMRAYDKDVGDNAFAHVDLDGPGLDPGRAADTVPCSYLLTANGYPCGLVDFKQTWREVFDGQVAKFGEGVPMARCYYHLPQSYVDAEEDSGAAPRPPDPAASPTHNITADLQVRSYRLEWQSEPGFIEAK